MLINLAVLFILGILQNHSPARGMQVGPGLIARIDGVVYVVLQAGRKLTLTGLFTQPRTLMSSPIAEQLGCALEDSPMGLFIKVDEGMATSVPNVFACGDAARAAGNVAVAVADGAMAGMGAHRRLRGWLRT